MELTIIQVLQYTSIVIVHHLSRVVRLCLSGVSRWAVPLGVHGSGGRLLRLHAGRLLRLVAGCKEKRRAEFSMESILVLCGSIWDITLWHVADTMIYIILCKMQNSKTFIYIGVSVMGHNIMARSRLTDIYNSLQNAKFKDIYIYRCVGDVT